MREDKGQNQVVNDWLLNSDATGVFLEVGEETVSYAELRDVWRRSRGGRTSFVYPRLTRKSVVEIYQAVAGGPTVVGSGAEDGIEPELLETIGSDVMTVLFTSGTTGEPKLVPLTSQNWLSAVEASASHLGHDSSDVWLLAMPLHHVGGLSILFRSSFVGARVRMLPDFEPKSFANALSSDVTIASVVPRMLRRVLDVDDRSFTGLKAVLVGGGPIPSGLLEEAQQRGIPALPTYGMTETCAQVATLKPGSDIEYAAHLLPGLEARIEPDGRIALRGDQVFSGYLAEQTRQRDDWFVTSDLGALANGKVTILGRADTVIVTGGENVDPIRLETIIGTHAGVQQALVVGIPSGEWGNEVVCLYVGDADAKAVDDWTRFRLPPHEVPKRWLRVDRIPTTAIGKPDRDRGRSLALET